MWTQLSSELSAEVDPALTAPGSKLQHGHVYPRKGALGAQNQRWGARARAQHSLAEQPAMWFLHSRLGHLFRRDTL